MSPADLQKLKAAAAADLAVEARAERRRRFWGWWRRLRTGTSRAARVARKVGEIVSVIGAIGAMFWKVAGYVERRRIPDAQPPASPGVPTTSPDFVKHPEPAAPPWNGGPASASKPKDS